VTAPGNAARTRAVRVWIAGWPHQAWEIMQAAGLSDEFPALNRELQLRMRKRFQRKMARYRDQRVADRTVH
jgi:hypothetical protein